AGAFLRAPHPYPDAILPPLARHVESRERADDPFLERGDEAPHVRTTALEIEHHIGHPLAGTMIGELPAAAGHMDRKARRDQLLGPRAGAGGIERRAGRGGCTPTAGPRPRGPRHS